MFSILIVGWAEQTEVKEYGTDLVAALKAAEWWSAFGNTDYLLLLKNGMPLTQFIDGEEKEER